MFQNVLVILLIIGIFSSFSFSTSYSLTESIEHFGQSNSVDLILNDIWIEPEIPKEGEAVTVHGSLYNAGIISSDKVTDVVTIAYFVNDELVEISLLENILPGIENGIEISSGPIFDATQGNYVVTVIVNYHDTLSHIRDNPENNIVQKIFQLGTDTPSLITSEIYQEYDDKTSKHQIRINGEFTNIFQEKLKNKEIEINVEGSNEKTVTDFEGKFSFEFEIPFENRLIEIQTHAKDKLILPNYTQTVFPIKLGPNQSALALETISDMNGNELNEGTLTVVIFQDSYDKLFKKFSTNDPRKDEIKIDNFVILPLPANHDYIVEIYFEGRIIDAFQDHFPDNLVIQRNIFISETAQLQFLIKDEKGEPQKNAIIENWIYSTRSNENGLTDWSGIIPTFTSNEPYVAKAIFPDGTITWSEPFVINENEKKVIEIIKGEK